MNVKQYEELRNRAERTAKEADRAAGARLQLLKQLKEKFGCESIEEAEKLLAKKQRLRDKAEKQAESLLAKFKEKYGELDRQN